jgi:hypothetical protein
MNIQELEHRLEEEACNKAHYSIGYRDSDVYCLMKIDGMWKMFYTERGLDQETMFESESEEAACEFFFKYQTERIRHDHIVGFFHVQANAKALAVKLKEHGIDSHENNMPYRGWHDPRFRVFVVGKNIFKAREILGELPIRDYADVTGFKKRKPARTNPVKKLTVLSANEFITKALAAIQKADYETLEVLRDEIKPEYVPHLLETWNKSMPWKTKNAYIALLMDQKGTAVIPIMEDALNSPAAESQAYALCILKGNFKLFDDLMTDGLVDVNKVDAAVARFRAENKI